MRGITRREAVVYGASVVPMVGLTAAGLASDHTKSSIDAPVAGCILVKGKRQTEVCNFAVAKLQNAECKQLCQTILQGLEQCQQKLSSLGFQFPKKSTDRGVVTAGGTDQVIFVVGTHQLPGGFSKMMEIDLELLDQCVKTTKSELGQKQGAKFDMCFVADQLHCHLAALDHCLVLRKHVSKELAAVFDQDRPYIERTIQTCKSILEKLHDMKG